jgi:hypothetical protein
MYGRPATRVRNVTHSSATVCPSLRTNDEVPWRARWRWTSTI